MADVASGVPAAQYGPALLLCLAFVLLPRRWVVERTFAWLGRNRRLAKDFEKTIESAEAWLMIASIQLLSRRIAGA